MSEDWKARAEAAERSKKELARVLVSTSATPDAMAALLVEREEMLAVLREVEWKGCEEDYDTEMGSVFREGGCPVCRGAVHYPDCRLAALLKHGPT